MELKKGWKPRVFQNPTHQSETPHPPHPLPLAQAPGDCLFPRSAKPHPHLAVTQRFDVGEPTPTVASLVDELDMTQQPVFLAKNPTATAATPGSSRTASTTRRASRRTGLACPLPSSRMRTSLAPRRPTRCLGSFPQKRTTSLFSPTSLKQTRRSKMRPC